MLMHWDNVDWADQIKEARSQIKEKDKKAFVAGDDRCPPYTWKGHVYNDGEEVALPNDVLRANLLRAAARVELSGKKTYKELSQCGLLFDDAFIAFTCNGKPLKWSAIEAVKGDFAAQAKGALALGFSLFVKRVAVGQAKHVRVRAKFDNWSCTGTVTVMDEQITPEVLLKIWTIGGLYLGLGDGRPGSPKSPGPYGCYRAELVAV
jgi:hypothetical protein